MDRFLRIAIPTMFAGIVLALIGVALSATSNGSNRDPVAKLAIGTLTKLDISEKGAPAPTTAFIGADGSSVTLQDFQGKAIMNNFWATWCGPCAREMTS